MSRNNRSVIKKLFFYAALSLLALSQSTYVLANTTAIAKPSVHLSKKKFSLSKKGLRDIPGTSCDINNNCDNDFGAVNIDDEIVEIYGFAWFDFETFQMTPIAGGGADFSIIQDDCVTNPPSNIQGCNIYFKFKPTSLGTKTAVYSLNYSGTYRDDNGIIRNYSGTATWNLTASGQYKLPNHDICEGGSIIRVTSRALGERIPLVGTDISLSYSSQYTIDYIPYKGHKSIKPLSNSYFNREGWAFSVTHVYDVQNRLLYRGTGEIEATNYDYDGMDNVYVVSKGGDEIYVFDYATGQHRQTLTFLTGSTKYTFNYDSNNYLTSIVDAFGKQISIGRDTNGLMTSITAPYGQVTNVTTIDGLLSTVTNPNNETYSMTYKFGTELLETFTKPGGQVSTFTYNSQGRLAKDLGNGGNFWELITGAGAGSLTKTSQMGRTTNYSQGYNATAVFGRNITDPTGFTTTYSETGLGSNVTETPLEKRDVTLDDDARFGKIFRRPSLIKYKVNGIESTTSISTAIDRGANEGMFDYNSLTNTTTTRGRSYIQHFDRATNTQTNTSPEGVSTTLKINEKEQPIEIGLGNEIKYTFSYDSDGRLQQAVQGTKNKLIYSYNTTGLLQNVTNDRSEVTSYIYDLAGRVSQILFPNNKSVYYSYDANGNMTSLTTPNGIAHAFEYDAMELTSKYLPPAIVGLSSKDTSYTYNLDRQLTQVSRPDGQNISYTYNSLTGLLNAISTPNGIYQYNYSSIGQIDSIQSPYGIKNSFIYRGPWVSEDKQLKSFDNSLLGKVAFGYDNDHRVVSRTVVDSTNSSVSTNITLNDDNKPIVVGDMSLTYNYPEGRLSSTKIQNISDSRSYDDYGNLEGYVVTYKPSGGTANVLYSYTLTRDNMSRITGKTETRMGVTTSYTYSYDFVGRLIEIKKNGSQFATFDYDNNGNRITSTFAGHTSTAAYDDQDRLQSFGSRTYTYNQNGDLNKITDSIGNHRNFTYDAMGSLIEITARDGRIYSYIQDGLNRRVAKISGLVQQRFLYEDTTKIAAELNSNGSFRSIFVYASGKNTPDYFVQGSNKYKIVTDHLGSPIIIVDASTGNIVQKMDYDIWGRVILDSNTCFQPFGFAGGLWDKDAGLVRFGARDYDPEVGRWTSKDPILFNGGDANLFGYVANDPINFIDPTGLTQKDLDLAIAWLRRNQPQLFVTVNPEFKNMSFSDATVDGHTFSDSLIGIDFAKLDTKCGEQRTAAYINTLAHEIQHAIDLKQMGYIGTIYKSLTSNRHDDIIWNASGIENQFLYQRPTKGILYPLDLH